MKIHQIAQGARFQYEGQIYTKTGPMMAQSEAGETRVIPRYVVLQPMDAVATAVDRPLDRQALQQAFDTFFQRCSELVAAADQAELQAARSRFLKHLQ
ncbi:MAG TPA: hypothetical protein VFK74_02760 [Azospira sp.]|nr:hypothetical protein [Azospira sp.]